MIRMHNRKTASRSEPPAIANIPDSALECFDTAAAARLVGLSTSWLAHARIRGEGPPFVRIGSRVFYSRPALLAWLTGNTIDPALEGRRPRRGRSRQVRRGEAA